MKHFVPFIMLLAGGLRAAPEDYVNFVRQIQQDSGVEWDVTVAPRGEMLSPEGVGPAGSLFQLWSIHGPTAFEYHLDEEFVSAYSPSAKIVIETGDPYPHIARTRVDQPFEVRIDINGLTHENGAPVEAGHVLLTHSMARYPQGRHSFAGQGGGASQDQSEVIDAGTVSSNGLILLEYAHTNLTGPDLTKVEGEEVWTVSAVTGGGTDPLEEADVLEISKLQVWPIAEAAFTGVDPAEKYSEVPPIRVRLMDLYPDSTTWVRVYAGPPAGDPEGAREISNSYVVIEDSIPQDRTVTLEEIESLFETSGSYTLEVLHRTPFGTDILTQFFPLQIDFSIRVRGTVYSGN